MSTSPTQKHEETSTNPPIQHQQPPSDPPTTNDASSVPQQPTPPTAVTDSSPNGIDKPDKVGDPPATGNAADSNAAKNNGATNDDATTVSDAQKKMRRAERFGVPVQTSEEEKRNSRAERKQGHQSSTGTVINRNPVRQTPYFVPANLACQSRAFPASDYFWPYRSVSGGTGHLIFGMLKGAPAAIAPWLKEEKN